MIEQPYREIAKKLAKDMDKDVSYKKSELPKMLAKADFAAMHSKQHDLIIDELKDMGFKIEESLMRFESFVNEKSSTNVLDSKEYRKFIKNNTTKYREEAGEFDLKTGDKLVEYLSADGTKDVGKDLCVVQIKDGLWLKKTQQQTNKRSLQKMTERKESEIKKMVKEIVREDCREEAVQILLLCEDKWYSDFVKNYKKGESGYNVCCMSLDFAKYDAVLLKKMKQKKTDKFGDIGWMLKD